MPLISIVILLIVLGLLLYLVEQLPIDAMIKLVIRCVVILAMILWLLQAAGFGNWTFPR